MYRRSLAMLWTGTALFATLAIIDAMVDFMGHMQGLWIGATMTCGLCSGLHIWFNKLNQTAMVNRERSEQLRDDVDKLSEQVREIDGKVDKVKDLTRAGLIKKAAEEDGKENEEGPLATVHTFRFRNERGHEAIVGKASRKPLNDESTVWDVLLAGNESRTLPGARTRPGTSAS